MAETIPPLSQLPPYFPDEVPRLFLKPFNISETEVKEALAGPVDVHSIALGGQTITLILSPKKAGCPHSSLLVQGEIYSRAFSVEFVLRVPDPIADDPQNAGSPRRMLEALANACGFEFSIGQRRAKYMEEELVRLTTESNVDLVKADGYPGAVYVSSTWTRVLEKNGVRIAQVARCFMLDAAAYKRAIGM